MKSDLELKRELDKTRQELDELRGTFELMWRADQRAIDRWRQEDPDARDLVRPDRTELIVWLLHTLDKKGLDVLDDMLCLKHQWLKGNMRLRCPQCLTDQAYSRGYYRGTPRGKEFA